MVQALGVWAAPLPPRPILGGIAWPGLVTEVVVSKFGDHLPLHRLEDILTRYGVYIPRSTLCDWVKATAEFLRPLYDLQRELALQSSLLWTDDSPVTVLGGSEGNFRGHFWTYIGDREHPYSVYDFTTSRSRDGPARFLRHYSGYLHADAYAGYDAIFVAPGSSIIEVACWSHARRKVFDGVRSYPREAHQVLEWIRQLYDIEDRAADWSVDARRELRAGEANPVLVRLSFECSGIHCIATIIFPHDDNCFSPGRGGVGCSRWWRKRVATIRFPHSSGWRAGIGVGCPFVGREEWWIIATSYFMEVCDDHGSASTASSKAADG